MGAIKFLQRLVFVFTLLVCAEPADALLRATNALPPPATGWYQNRIGAGGFPRHMDVADDGTRLIGTDTYGANALLPGGTQSYQLFTTASMPAGTFDIKTNAAGVFEVAICSGNPNVAYVMAADGKIYKTTNLQSAANGVTFTQLSAFTAMAAYPTNTLQNTWGRIMVCDPANTAGNVLLVGTPTGGMYYTTDGGSTFTHSGSISSAASGAGTLVGFDRTSSVTGSGSTAQTQGIYAFTSGVGVYKSTTGASGTFSRLNSAGEPTSAAITTLHVDPLGRAWVAGGNTNVQVYNGSAWVTNVSPDNGTSKVATDPNNCSASGTCHVVLMGDFGAMYTSSTGGLSAGAYSGNLPTSTTISGDLGYISAVSPIDTSSGFSIGEIAFDKAVSGRLNISGGQFGFMYAANPFASGSGIAYTTLAKGIEQLDIEQVLSPVGSSDVYIVSADLALFIKTQATLDQNASAFALSYGNPYIIVPGWSADDCATTTRVIASDAGFGGTNYSGISTNSGASFTQWGAIPASVSATQGGWVACSTATKQVYISKGSNKAYRTSTGGGAWTASTTTFPTGFSPSAQALSPVAQIIAADKTTTDVYYAWNATNGLYKSTDNGDNWTKQFNEPDPTHTGSSMILRCSWLVSGDCLMTTGWQSTLAMPTGQQFWRTTQGSPMTVAKVPGMCSVMAMDFGAQVSGQSYPSITLAGWYNASDTTSTCDPGSLTYVFSVWQSTNNGSTWINLGLPKTKPSDAGNNVNWIPSLACDKLIQGKCYAGTFGSGAFYYQP